MSSGSIPRTPTIIWLLDQGANSATPGILLSEVCGRLVAEGLPIAAAVLSIASLDPIVAASRIRWRRSDGLVVAELQFYGMSSTDQQVVEQESRNSTATHPVSWTVGEVASLDTVQREYLDAVCLAMKAPLKAVVERETTRALLRAYLGRRSSEKVLSGTVHRGTGEAIDAVIWLSDLRDFTQLSATYPLEQVIAALDDCCARLVGAIQPYGGEVLKFIGDGLLAIFPLAGADTKAVCRAALASIRAARQGMARLDEARTRSGLPPLPFGVALHIGAVMYGNIGAPDRLDFTAIGPGVNVASRIQDFCRALDCPVLISQEFAERCEERLIPLGQHPLRGIAEPVGLFTIPELRP